MYSEVYFHRVRLAYNQHLQDFLKSWLPNGVFRLDVNKHLKMTDSEVLAAIREAAGASEKSGHESAKRIFFRNHYKRLYSLIPEDRRYGKFDALERLRTEAAARFGEENVRSVRPKGKVGDVSFPVLRNTEEVIASTLLSETIQSLKPLLIEILLINPDLGEEGATWLRRNKKKILGKGECDES